MKRIALCFVGVLLAGCGGRSTEEWVTELKASDSSRRLHAIKALEGRGEAAEVVPALADSLRDPDPFVRRDAARALGEFGPDARAALPALAPLLRDRNAGVRRAAAKAVRKIDAGAGVS